MLWSWQHNDDLPFVDGRQIGVSYFVGLVTLSGEAVKFTPSLSRLTAPAGLYNERAVRVETHQLSKEPTVLDALAERVAREILRRGLSGSRRVDCLQIDYDARLSERPFYKALLRAVRAGLPTGVQLSITSLASWCLQDNWIGDADLPVDEVVPMFFSMGRDHEQVVNMLRGDFALPDKNSGIAVAPGFSVQDDEPARAFAGRLKLYKTVYFFSSSGWNKGRFEQANKLRFAVN
jgi:hypothetical protein